MIAALALVAAAAAVLLPGTYTNEEQVYFARDAGTLPLPWVGLKISVVPEGYRLQTVDAFGAAKTDDQVMHVSESDAITTITTITTGSCVRGFARVPAGLTAVDQRGQCSGPPALITVTGKGLALKMADGSLLEMQRARPWKCWVSIPKAIKKPDGSTDWWFKPGLLLHDAGGRLRAATDEATPQTFTLRMRNVAWPSGPNQPSLVLYVHADDPDHAISYSWADPGAKRVGINLRSVQASCSLVG